MSRNPGQPKTDLAKLKEQCMTSAPAILKNSYPITIVTPMFGGGYEAGKIDEKRLVRESTIRGQLRFWWRATRGAAFANAYELRKREAEIFGDTSRPSNVKVRVEVLSASEAATYTPRNKGNSIPSYLFQQSKDDKNKDVPLQYISKCTFRLYLQWSVEAKHLEKTQPSNFEELNRDMRAALWGWINFGGIGSRTRRGCGSLYCKEFSPSRNDCNESSFLRWLDRCIKAYRLILPAENGDREWPTLNPNMLLQFDSKKNNFMWSLVIGQYKKFRRSAPETTYYDNKKGRTLLKIGRSYWPEADSIRKTLDMAHTKHDTPTHFFRSNPKEEVTAFPRAELGMPIIFQFKEVREPIEKYIKGRVLKKSKHEEPYKTQLTPANKQRLASPLILKPLAFSKERGVGLIAVLNHPPIENLDLQLLEGEEKKVYPVTINDKHLDYLNSPMRDRKDEQTVYQSAIEAFLNSKEVEAFCRTTNLKRH